MAPNKTVFIIVAAVLLASAIGGAGYLAETHPQEPTVAPAPTQTAAVSQSAPAPAPGPSAQQTSQPRVDQVRPTQVQPSMTAPEVEAPTQEVTPVQNTVLVPTAPPPLPVYVVPAPPAPNVIWAPGHWRWNGMGYYWVPGTWVRPPVVGVLWTPGYWQSVHGSFGWHEGYWAPHVGFYGGINYGGGYIGIGFHGGTWNGNTYNVNRAVTNVSTVTNVTNITNVRNVTNITNNNVTTSFNGGPGGVSAAPTAQEQAVATEKHIAPTQEQTQHAALAAKNPALLASANHGAPSVAATTKPADFSHGVIAAKPSEPEKAPTPELAHAQPKKEKPEVPEGKSVTEQTKPAAGKTKPAALAPHSSAPHLPQDEKNVHPAATESSSPTSHPSKPIKAPATSSQSAKAPARSDQSQAKKPQDAQEKSKKENSSDSKDDKHDASPQHSE